MTVEVYSCRPGQQLKEGKLDYAPHITDKEQAEADAKRRIAQDPGLHKIAYYNVKEDGGFRVLYSYTNPNPRAAPRKMMGDVTPRKRSAKSPPKKDGFWTRMLRGLGLG